MTKTVAVSGKLQRAGEGVRPVRVREQVLQCSAGILTRRAKITSELTKPKETSSFGRHPTVTGNHITPAHPWRCSWKYAVTGG